MQENKYRNLDYFSLSYNLYHKNAFCLTNCKENAISPDKFKIFDKKQKRNDFIFFEMLTKCINFAAENEHSVKERLDLNSNQ
jgi:hypothetical protein